MIKIFKKYKISRTSRSISRTQALRMMEASYLAASSALIWVALYYLPIGGSLFRLALPLPIALLQIRRGSFSGFEGVSIAVLLLAVIMGPVRGPLYLFPYGLLALLLGLSWQLGLSWWVSWGSGVLIGISGFFIRVFILSLLVGENLWVIITRAGALLIERFVELFGLQFVPEISHVQFVAFLLVVLQEIIYVLTLHALAFWIFPRLKAPMPSPPNFLNSLVVLDPH